MVKDLFSDEIIFHEDGMNKDLGNSHFGYPLDIATTDYYMFLDKAIPEKDPYEVYGFNFNVERSRNIK
jgi:hypothetical protein